jgi:hypothetical protein
MGLRIFWYMAILTFYTSISVAGIKVNHYFAMNGIVTATTHN